ncbi:MAG: class I tRNA ligase family protein, partial [Candidatus Bipolaricaulota bacterium]
MSLTLYNSLSGELQDFRPLDPEKVRMYSCGPTVYDYFHIGNARPFIVFDGLRRYLEFKGYDVTYVQNVTDVEDKIINRAAEEDLKPADLAQKYMDAYFKDMERLGINPADLNPKVTDYIPQIIDHVRDLEQNGYAYSVDGDVYFRVSKFSEYGKLSGRSLDELQSGSRVEIDEAKENPLDFALWKRSSSD